ncbi:DNA modification system-associated small protein [Cytobacillus sp. FJAT-53684]|uniref:DNA modification system-associated small protein n=1 Tax=Cytobacillus mangrovibacter TaxID=3299024 RepID=A0ABW6K2P1_9BACI
MRLSNEDKLLLQDLCSQHQVSFEKVLKLLDTVQEYEVKERRTGIYDALREIVRSVPREVTNEVQKTYY